MRSGTVTGLLLATMLGGSAVAQTSPSDCSNLKGKARKDCIASAASAPAPDPAAKKTEPPTPSADGFPEEQSKHGNDPPKGDDMPSAGVPDPPASSMGPGEVPGSSSSSSSSSGGSQPVPDDDAAPTTSGSDTPIKPGTLKNLGSRPDSSQARQKLEQTRVEDDLRVGHFYFQDGNYAGATARYQDALTRDADNPDAHFGLAQVLLKQNKRAEAATHLERYLQLAPDDDHTKDARKMLAKLR